MNFLIVLAFLSLIGASCAAISQSKDLALLLDETFKKADVLVVAGEKILFDVQKNQPHLAVVLLHLVQEVKNVKLRMETALVEKKIVIEFPQVHVMQEQLLQLQNEILAQSDSVIEKVKHNSANNNVVMTKQTLNEWAQRLLKETKEALVKYVHTPEKSLLNFEVKTLEQLAKDISSNDTVKQLDIEKQQLSLHELTVKDLEAKADWRTNQPEV